MDEEQANILIIDDVILNLMVLTDIIRKAGYIARPVKSVRHAKAAIKAALPSIILLDVTMPDIDGYEYCLQLKKDVITRNIPVIFISALTSAKDRIHGFDCGAVDFISKPFEKAEVLVRVNTHLKLYSMQKEMTRYNRKLNKLVNHHLYKSFEDRKNMTCSMARIIEMRDVYGQKHLDRISKNCRLLALSLQLTTKYEQLVSNDFISVYEVSVRLHDIGKILIADSILNKKQPLNAEEDGIMRTHAEAGAEFLQKISEDNPENEFIRLAIDIAYYHHEKWDGSGFPCGLSGSRIPLPARMTAIIDTYDALTNRRCYKPSYTHEEAMKIINNEAGKSFDPELVNILNMVQRQLIRDNEPDCMESIPNEQRFDSRR